MKHYAVVIEKMLSGYGAHVPDLPGCIAAGDTYEEAERLIHEAIPFHVQGLIKHGDPVPEPSPG